MRARPDLFVDRQGGALKLLLVGVLTLAMLVPLTLVEGVIRERAWRSDAVLQDIARQHGGEQRLIGPLLVVPYVREFIRRTTDAETGETREVLARADGVAVVLPETLDIEAALGHSIRRRGIYEAPVYEASGSMAGAFRRPDLAAAIPDLASVDWARAAVVLHVGDLAGLAEAAPLETAGGAVAFAAGAPAYAVETFGALPGGGVIHAALAPDWREGARLAFSTKIRLKGSGGFFAAPTAGVTTVRLAGDWPHPSFQGAPLPDVRNVTADGFAATWRVPALARGYASVWHGGDAARLLREASAGAVGFRHVRPDDPYNAAIRSAKDGILLVSLTFLACFILERIGGRRLHTAQYGLVGLALALFYLLVTAVGERIGFAPAYAVAAGTIALMNGVYVGAALKSWPQGGVAAGTLGLLFGAFYVMLSSEDDAMLIGAGLLLLALAAAMAATTRLNAPASADGAQPDSDGAGV